jgi:diguanylate cyclase (GGDEF)-like protein
MSNLEQSKAMEVADRIRRSVEQKNFDVGIGAARVAVTLSMGISSVRERDTADSLFARADKALYHSKQSGRNKINVCNEDPADEPLPAAAELSAAD